MGGGWLPSIHHRSHDQGGMPNPPDADPSWLQTPWMQNIPGCRTFPPPPMGYYGIRSTSGRYAPYWKAFLLSHLTSGGSRLIKRNAFFMQDYQPYGVWSCVSHIPRAITSLSPLKQVSTSMKFSCCRLSKKVASSFFFYTPDAPTLHFVQIKFNGKTIGFIPSHV